VNLTTLGIWSAAGVIIGGAGAYRLQTLGGASDDYGYNARVDADNNIYAVGRTNSAGAGAADALLVKYDPTGSILWQRALGGVSNELFITGGLTVDSNGDVYLVGDTDSAGAGQEDVLIAKYDSSGTIQWQRILGGATLDDGRSVATDSSNNVYVVGLTSTGVGTANYQLLIAKYNSSGTIQWQKTLGNASIRDQATSIAIDSSDNIYVAGVTNFAGSGLQEILVVKYDTAGAVQWQRILGGASADQASGVVVDSNGDVYVSFRSASTGLGGTDAGLAKYDSSGTLQWQRALGGANFDLFDSVSIDLNDNLYVVGQTASAGTGTTNGLIAKYNSSGTIQWQRTLSTTAIILFSGTEIDKDGNLIVVGRTNTPGAGNYDLLIGLFPPDGSLTGTYVLDGENMIYAASSLTSATSTLTGATPTLTEATSTLTAATSSLTSSTITLTEYRVDL